MIGADTCKCVPTMTDHHRISRRAAALFGAAVLAAACSGSDAVAADDVETEAAEKLAAEVGSDVAPNVDCPEDLDAEVGAELTCELTVEGDSAAYPVYIEVTSVDGDNANFSVEVGEEPNAE